MSTPEHREADDTAWQPRLSLWDATSLMIGIVVGTSLFVLPPLIFRNVSSPWIGIAAWTLGGLLSLIGAIVFAEMAVSIPKGGSYAYLTAAFGRPAGLLYGVAIISIIVTTTVGAMAFAFAGYAAPFLGRENLEPLLAATAVALLAGFNTFSLRSGKNVQNVLTAAKLLGLLAIAVAGLLTAPQTSLPVEPVVTSPSNPKFGLAMVLVLYAYGGWSDAASVAAEVRSRQRNVPLALIGGLAGITAIYVLVNLSYLRALGWEGLQNSDAPAREALQRAAGDWAGAAVSVIVMISALGAVHGMLFSGSRSVAALGEDHVLFRPLSVWSHSGVPLRAIWLLALIAIAQIGIVGTERGRAFLDRMLTGAGLQPVPWNQFDGGFETLVAASAPTFWVLMIGAGLAFFQLRRLKLTPREFQCPGGPILPLTYCGTCLFMLYNSINYAGTLGLLGLVPCVVAALLLPFSLRRAKE